MFSGQERPSILMQYGQLVVVLLLFSYQILMLWIIYGSNLCHGRLVILIFGLLLNLGEAYVSLK